MPWPSACSSCSAIIVLLLSAPARSPLHAAAAAGIIIITLSTPNCHPRCYSSSPSPSPSPLPRPSRPATHRTFFLHDSAALTFRLPSRFLALVLVVQGTVPVHRHCRQSQAGAALLCVVFIRYFCGAAAAAFGCRPAGFLAASHRTSLALYASRAPSFSLRTVCEIASDVAPPRPLLRPLRPTPWLGLLPSRASIEWEKELPTLAWVTHRQPTSTPTGAVSATPFYFPFSAPSTQSGFICAVFFAHLTIH